MNAYATAVLSVAVNPDLAGDEAERVRARVAQAGLLESSAPVSGGKEPDRASLAAARRRAGTGISLAELVADGRR